MELTKNVLSLVDVLLERVREELLSSLNLGATIEGEIDISGDTDLEEKIDETLKPAVQALALALRIAEFARLDTDKFLWEKLLYFTDEAGDVRMISFSDLQRAWRPLPPGPGYKLEELPPEDISLPDIEGGDQGPIQ